MIGDADSQAAVSGGHRSAWPLVSIITPTLNQGRFIEATLRSVMGQTYPHIEHIVVDGGSSDETISLLTRYEGRYLLRWGSEPDNGMYHAVNKGLRDARGEFVAYLNSDDLLLPWAVEVAVSQLMDHPHTALIFGDALQVDDATRELRLFFQPSYRHDYLATIGSFAQPATFWRRQIHETVGEFDERLQFAGDLDFYLRVSARLPIRRVNEFLAIMRLHPAMKTQALAGRSHEENRLVRARYVSRPGRGHVFRSRLRAWRARRQLWLAFAARARQPGSTRNANWARFLTDGAVHVSTARLLVAQLPLIGLRVPSIASSGIDWLATPTPPFRTPAITPGVNA